MDEFRDCSVLFIKSCTSVFVTAHSGITDEHFPAMAEPSLEGAQIEVYGTDVSSEYVLADLTAKKRRAATAAEVLLYGIQNPSERRTRRIVGLGQIWSGPGYGKMVVALGVCDGSDLGYVSLARVEDSDWGRDYVFLSFPL